MPRRFYIALSVAIGIMVAAAVVLAEEKRADRAGVIIGEVVSISITEGTLGTLTVKEDGTGKEHRIKADEKRLKAAGIEEGYRVEVKAVGQKATAIRVLGMPMKAEPQLHQIIKVEREG